MSTPITPGYVQALLTAEPEPVFQSDAEQEAIWGAPWGPVDEVGRLREVCMRAPGAALADIGPDALDERAAALVAPDRQWYWNHPEPPDLARLRAEHDGLRALLEREGVTVRMLPEPARHLTKAIYTRDPFTLVRGGAIVGRMALRMRRGEEADVTRFLAGLGAPIAHTIAGAGMFEGGSLLRLAPGLVAYGLSRRCDADGARQLADVLRWLDIELIEVPLTGYAFHLDGALALLDRDLALVRPELLPYTFLADLERLGFELLYADPDEGWAVNLLALAPRRVVISDGVPRTAERLAAAGVEVLTLPYDEVHKNGGGIHCSTNELVRDPA